MHMLHDVNEKQEIQVRTIATMLITLHRKHLDSSAAFEWFVCIEVVAFMIFFSSNYHIGCKTRAELLLFNEVICLM